MLATKRLAPLIIGQVLATIITLAVLVVVARMLGTALYGLYAFAFGYQAFIDGVVAWGIGVYYGRELAKNTHDRDVKGIVETLTSGFVIALPIAIILTLIGIGFSGVVANSWFSSLGISQSSLILVSPISFFIVIQSSIYMALIALRRSGLGAIVVVTTDVLQLVSIVLLIMAGYGVNGAIGGMLFGYAVGTVLAAYFLYVAASKYGKLALQDGRRWRACALREILVACSGQQFPQYRDAELRDSLPRAFCSRGSARKLRCSAERRGDACCSVRDNQQRACAHVQ